MMNADSDHGAWDENDDEDLPDEAFTELELKAGVQHLMRSSSVSPPRYWPGGLG